jgi:hypothetical protein
MYSIESHEYPVFQAEPPKVFNLPTQPPAAAAASGGFGFGTVMRFFMVGSYVYRAGGGGSPTGWSPHVALAAVQQNPMQGAMMLLMLYSSM